ncbi:hypothetical protein FQR65_LT02697 [Abscondita terminalis]|nr:hypothetical protein FQR65_LT02697 [Abscondita terminalis]
MAATIQSIAYHHYAGQKYSPILRSPTQNALSCNAPSLDKDTKVQNNSPVANENHARGLGLLFDKESPKSCIKTSVVASMSSPTVNEYFLTTTMDEENFNKT